MKFWFNTKNIIIHTEFSFITGRYLRTINMEGYLFRGIYKLKHGIWERKYHLL